MSKTKTTKSKKAKRKAVKKLKIGRLIIVLLILGALVYGARLVAFEPVKITTDAMAPTYASGDTVMVNKLTLWKEFNISRGDIVYASFAGDSARLIRRVVGIEGDLIDIREDGTYLVDTDGNETYLGSETTGLTGGTLPYGAYLLLGDTAAGLDSRTLGLVYRTDILGIPGKIIWPISRI